MKLCLESMFIHLLKKYFLSSIYIYIYIYLYRLTSFFSLPSFASLRSLSLSSRSSLLSDMDKMAYANFPLYISKKLSCC